MEYRVCVCPASLVGKERSKETKWSYEIVEKAARVVERARDYVRRMLQKSCLLFEEIDVEVTEIFWFWLFVEKRECRQKMLPRGEVVTRCWNGIRHHSRHSQFWGWRKVVPVCGILNVSNQYSTGKPWSKKNNQGVHELEYFPHGAMLLLLLLLLWQSRR